MMKRIGIIFLLVVGVTFVLMYGTTVSATVSDGTSPTPVFPWTPPIISPPFTSQDFDPFGGQFVDTGLVLPAPVFADPSINMTADDHVVCFDTPILTELLQSPPWVPKPLGWEQQAWFPNEPDAVADALLIARNACTQFGGGVVYVYIPQFQDPYTGYTYKYFVQRCCKRME